MRRRKGYFTGITLLILSMVVFLVQVSDRPAGGILPEGEVSMGDLAQKIEDIRLTSYDRDHEILRLRASSAEFRRLEERIHFNDLEVVQSTGDALPWSISGATGTLDPHSKDLRIDGTGSPVVVKVGSRYRLETSVLTWVHERREVRTDEKIHLVGPGFVLDGKGFTGDVVNGIYEVRQAVHAILAD